MLLPLLLLSTAPMLAQAAEWREDPRIDALFADSGVRGTLVVHDVAADAYTVHDRQRARQRFVPASTFKIPNSLIGLDSGVAASVDTVLPYGGGTTSRPEWAHDMSLREAIKISNVPLYQGMARRIGLQRMQDKLRTFDYGNGEIGSRVDNFWLKGPLQISALEQTGFLQRLAQDRLPFSKAAMAAVRDITRQDGSADLHAKTGLGGTANPDIDIGWWVGWLVKDGKLYTFALNIDVVGDTAAKRVPLGKAALTALGLL
ncbi:class D beta-lactamase [Massilia sp. PWRC2]|uniref:class D beta-lactamase n=1 Tax=Massilia sp. PWRC2 TaxID=2804626 RepID=UPI003CEBCB09